ncbi:APC5 protein [Recurvomyces mirabilis]|nr:APC5 protein [Recurvomyces mirabilis]
MQHDLQTLMPAASLFDSAVLERLGQSHVAGLAHDVVRCIHADQAPLADRVRSVCRSAYNAAQAGQCKYAMEVLESLLPVVSGVLKLEQRIIGFMSLVQLVKNLAMAKLDHARYHLAQLKPLRSLGDTEVDFELNLVDIELAIQESDLERAMALVDAELRRAKHTTSHIDVSQRLHYMVVKSRIFAIAGQASQGFSIASRAASTAMRLKLIPTLLEATLSLAVILNELAEYDAVIELLEATVPKINECRPSRLYPRALYTLAEAHVGLAGLAEGAGRNRLVRDGEDLFERARDAYSYLSDHSGMLDCLAMKSLLAK